MQSRRSSRKPVNRDTARTGERSVCARDRLLSALKTAPRLKKEDADRIVYIVQESREASIGKEIFD